MRYIFQFPDIGEGIEEGRILGWLVRPGQSVKSGDPLVKVETDKVVADIPSPKAGILVSTFGREGETIHVGDSLVELELEGMDGLQAQAAAKEETPLKTMSPVEEKGFGVVGTLEVAGDRAILSASDEGLSSALISDTPERKVLATPVARALARELGIDIQQVKGSGPGERITKIDVQNHRQAEPVMPTSLAKADAEVTYEPLTRIRKAIAARMSAAKQHAAHMTLFWEPEVDQLVSIRSRHKERLAQEGVRLSYLPFVIQSVISGLRAFPHFNSVLDLENERIILKHFYNIGIAVDGESGLTVPVLKHADRLSLRETAAAIQTLAEKARKRELALEDLRDGTFTITNFGALGGSFGVPVLNYPEVAILGVGKLQEKPVVRNGQLAIGHILPLSLTVDHRLIDGGDAARFIQHVAERLSDPTRLLLE